MPLSVDALLPHGLSMSGVVCKHPPTAATGTGFLSGDAALPMVRKFTFKV
jgi:hypothetical protein